MRTKQLTDRVNKLNIRIYSLDRKKRKNNIITKRAMQQKPLVRIRLKSY